MLIFVISLGATAAAASTPDAFQPSALAASPRQGETDRPRVLSSGHVLPSGQVLPSEQGLPFADDEGALVMSGMIMFTGMCLGVGLYGVSLLVGVDISKQAFAGLTQIDVNNRTAQLIGGGLFAAGGFAGFAVGAAGIWLLLEE